MDNQKNPVQPDDSSWLDEFFSSPELAEEIAADELAMHEAGLSHPSDMEVDRIIQETLAEDATRKVPDLGTAGLTPPQPAEPASLPEEDGFKDDRYRDTFGEGTELQGMFASGAQPAAEAEEAADEPAAAAEPDAEPAAEPEVPKSRRKNKEEPVKKGRPRRKKGYGLLGIPHILATVIWLVIVVAIGTSLGRMIWVCAADVLAFGREDMTEVVPVTITEDDTNETIAQKLHEAGLIRYPGLFKLYADITDADVDAGTFQLKMSFDYMALVDNMYISDSYGDVVTIVIPEGYTCRQIFALLEENGICAAAELEEYAANGELDDYWFLEGVARGDRYCLEGFLFPDTYDFYMNDNPRRVLEKFLNDFDYRFTEKMRGDLETLNQRLSEMMSDNGYGDGYIAEHQIDVRELVTVASLIEKESGNALESYTIASVFYNRLTDQASYPFLNSDAALYYVLEGKEGELTAEDLLYDSPYNTHIYPGLMPGPIANPGLNSLYAALDPDDTDYHYFIYNADEGFTHFSETYDEHQRYAAELGLD